ncbi:hypothetical protein J7F03_27205 [Streptomyces sp. ISL-43]|uniref:hypothetical protein n=1 Tax=Streptomyces sp. ISL-43 TaxID=2819183 RepID=UPI001BE934EC|nr:hypothetical protein [Streptomyces sp. ISL-43]MBT2450693.1 hypothetical protein [Streptomyces sp. ISL-43]
MITLSVDTTSQSYAVGQVTGALLVGVVAIVLVWQLTGSWRKAVAAPGTLEPAEKARVQAKRRMLIIGVMVLIGVGSTVRAASMYYA